MRFTDYFGYQVRTRPDDLCLSDETRRLSYADTDRASNRLAAALSTFPPQSRIAVVADNSVDFLLLDLATTKANLVLVPLNTRLIPDEWAQILEHSDAVAVFADDAYRDGLDTVRARLHKVTTWVALGTSRPPGWLELEHFLSGSTGHPCAATASEGDVDLQLYTSGTTGLPKGVLHSHRSMTMSISQWAQMVEPSNGLREGRCLIAAPLFHGAALIMWRTAICWGGHVQTQPRFDADAVLDAAVESPIAWTFLVPSMIHACLERIRDRPPAEYQFNLVMYGGSPIAEVVLRDALAHLGRNFLQIYGMTESLLATALTPADHVRALDGRPHLLLSAGRPVAGVRLRIDTGASTAPSDAGEVGELVIDCPNPMVGYSKNPTATEQMIRGDRLHTGDAGYLDTDGYLYVNGRIKDMIVTGGENVYSEEVEDILHAHPLVADAAVIGTPHPRWGETVTAILVAQPGHDLDAKEVVSFCKERISPYKAPKRIEVVEALPRNSMGKLLKHKLREHYSDSTARSI